MEVHLIIAGIDEQIARLTEARGILGGTSAPEVVKKPGRGRPKGSKNAATKAKEKSSSTGKRNLSPEGRKRIADAMKRRWEERKKIAAK